MEYVVVGIVGQGGVVVEVVGVGERMKELEVVDGNVGKQIL